MTWDKEHAKSITFRGFCTKMATGEGQIYQVAWGARCVS